MSNNLSDNDAIEEDIIVKNIEWTQEHEGILIEWADKAMCYRWLHSKSNMLYSRLNAWYTIPVIIISTITGTANFAQERVPIEYQGYFSMIVGAFSLVAGIITTIQQFLKITQLNEAHRVSSIAWDKFYRNIKIEIAKHPAERMEVTQMIKMSKEEYDRLMETSPNIPEKIVAKFKISFKENKSFEQIIKPEICDILVPTNEHRNPWYNEENQTKRSELLLKNKTSLKNKQTKTDADNNKIVTEFINTFKQLNNRDPMESEIIDNLKDKLDIAQIKKIFSDVNTLTLQIADSEDEPFGLSMV